jgi:divalent metal cation (Fe/Co/Zn/Cd) transporter
MSVVLLASSLLYALTGFAYADALGAAGLAYFSVREGMESLKKARTRSYEECC